MLLDIKGTPKTAEMYLLRLVLPDFFLVFLLFSAFGSIGLLYTEAIGFPQILLVIPAVIVLSAVLSFFRFYSFLANVLRSTGALELIYGELGEGAARIRVEFPDQFLVLGFIARSLFQPFKSQDYVFYLESDSVKYKAKTMIALKAGAYVLDIKLTDWRGQDHGRIARGRVASLQSASTQVVDELRVEVLETKGVAVSSMAAPADAYAPQATRPVVPVRRPAMPMAPVAAPAKPSALAELDRATNDLMAFLSTNQPTPAEKRVEAQAVEVKGQLAVAKPAEKAALQDVLFQLEEIDKVLKKK